MNITRESRDVSTVSVVVPQLLRERLEARAEREDSTLSRELRAALRRYLADEPRPELAAGRAPLRKESEHEPRPSA